MRDKQRGIIEDLANFILIINDKKLLMSSNDLGKIKIVKQDYEENLPNVHFIIEYHGIKCISKNNATDVARKWKEVKGYSLWQVMNHKN